jgi:hypothetical protein
MFLISGTRFDIKEFHSVVLRNGPMSLTTLEMIVNKWIEDVKQQHNSASSLNIHLNLIVLTLICVVNFI